MWLLVDRDTACFFKLEIVLAHRILLVLFPLSLRLSSAQVRRFDFRSYEAVFKLVSTMKLFISHRLCEACKGVIQGVTRSDPGQIPDNSGANSKTTVKPAGDSWTRTGLSFTTFIGQRSWPVNQCRTGTFSWHRLFKRSKRQQATFKTLNLFGLTSLMHSKPLRTSLETIFIRPL